MPLIVKIRRELRRGREVTTLSGLASLGDRRLAELTSALKRRCAAGGSHETDGTILIQGDHRDAVSEEIEKLGFVARRAGG